MGTLPRIKWNGIEHVEPDELQGEDEREQHEDRQNRVSSVTMHEHAPSLAHFFPKLWFVTLETVGDLHKK